MTALDHTPTMLGEAATERGIDLNGGDAAVVALAGAVAAERSISTTTTGADLTAYANNGRWIADCPTCGAGVACSPDMTKAACLECCTVYTSVVFPGDIADIETALVVRPVGGRNWTDGETVADLVEENWRHGVGPGVLP